MSIISPWGQVIVSPFNNNGLPPTTPTSNAASDPTVQNSNLPRSANPETFPVGAPQFNGINGYVPAWYTLQTAANPTATTPTTPPAAGQTPTNAGAGSVFTNTDTAAAPWLTSPFPTNNREGRNLTGIPDVDTPTQTIEGTPSFLQTPFSTATMTNYLDIAEQPGAKAIEEETMSRLVKAANQISDNAKDKGSDTDAVKKMIEEALAKAGPEPKKA
jgi:hypothetical protein